jgi:ribosomal protein S18 acetylase RimI-like enzyme
MIRKYLAKDRKKIKHLYRDALYLEPTFSCYLDKHYKPFVYEKDGKIIGVIVLQQDYLMIDVFNLYVDIDHRGKGIGQVLMNFAEEYTRKKKLHGVKVETSKDNERAQSFYLKCGYQKVGEVKNYRVKNGTSIFFWKGFPESDLFLSYYINQEKSHRLR